MDIRLIAMDLDGTALQPDRCSFSSRLNAALKEAHKRGIAIVPVTGRQFNMLPPAVQNLKKSLNCAHAHISHSQHEHFARRRRISNPPTG